MRINVKVITNAKKTELIPLSKTEFKAKLTAIPEKEKANKQLIKLISKHFNVPKSNISLKLGKSASNKVIEIT